MYLLHPEVVPILKNSSKFSDTRQLRDITVTGASLPKEKLIELKCAFPNTRVFQLYTITEAAGPITFYNLKDNYDLFVLHNYPSACGRPMAGVRYRVGWH